MSHGVAIVGCGLIGRRRAGALAGARLTACADVVVVAFGTPAKYVRAAVTRLRAEGARIGYVRPITLLPFPSEILVDAARGARTVAVYENSQGQMVDDVRLALQGAVPVQFIGRLSLDSSGFGIAPDLDDEYLRDKLLEVLHA